MCGGSLVGVTYLRFTVLTGYELKKGETVFHCTRCDPVLSVLVMLAPRIVFHVVLASKKIKLVSILIMASIKQWKYKNHENSEINKEKRFQLESILSPEMFYRYAIFRGATARKDRNTFLRSLVHCCRVRGKQKWQQCYRDSVFLRLR